MKASLKYPKSGSAFWAELRTQVDAYFRENDLSRKATSKFKRKIFIMFCIYWLFYAAIYTLNYHPLLLVLYYALMGGMTIVLGLNIGHDAAHNAIFKRRKSNERLLMVFEMLGTSSFLWKQRHIYTHHAFPNVLGYDSDVQQTNVVKIFPNDRHRKIHRFQHWYMPLLYMVYILRWVIYRDFKHAFSKEIGAYDNKKFPIKELVKMIVSKLVYLGYLIVVPAIYFEWSLMWSVSLFLIQTLAGSLVIVMVLLSSHVGEDAVFPEPNQEGELPFSWAEHQVITTADFATRSRWITEIFGGFNHHVIHHLFPDVCHCHYPMLTPILESVAGKHLLHYRSEKDILSAVRSHFRLLKKNSEEGVQLSTEELVEF